MTQSASVPTRKRPSGRRAGDSGTRDAILDAARDLFAAHGYEKASLRTIAAAAGVDPALIRHFFGDKERLFAATIADRTVIPQRLADSLPGDPDGIGLRVTDAYLQLWEDDQTRPVLMSLVRSATTSDRAARLLTELLSSRMRESSRVISKEQTQCVAIAAAHLFGVAVARHILHVPAITSLSHERLVAQVAPAIQRYLADTHM